MERIGTFSIEADPHLRRTPPSPRPGRKSTGAHPPAPEPEYSLGGDTHQGAVSHGPSKLPRCRPSTRSHQSHVSYQDDLEPAHSLSRGSHGHPPSSSVSLGPGSVPRTRRSMRSHKSHVSYQDIHETEYSSGRDSYGHPPSSTVSLGPGTVPRSRLSRRSHQSDVSWQRDQGMEYSSLQGSYDRPPVIAHSRQDVSEWQHPETILERTDSSDYTQASSDGKYACKIRNRIVS
jgi:hypothetical protein